jgi:UDP-N-acetyl-D-mannosaminuronate dehydrogenase
MGEIGSSMKRVLEGYYEVEGIDKDTVAEGKFGTLHVSFPYFDGFIKAVNDYAEKYAEDDGLIIIHSTVPVGTTDLIQGAVHSPVRGVHPNLEGGIRTFIKYFGGSRAHLAAEVFEAVGVKCRIIKDARNTEALKLWSTTYYGHNIIFEKALWDYCEKHGLDFDFVYKDANLTYNTGYKELGREDVLRPVLRHMDGQIGGHCVLPNAKLLGDEDIALFLLNQNEKQ